MSSSSELANDSLTGGNASDAKLRKRVPQAGAGFNGLNETVDRNRDTTTLSRTTILPSVIVLPQDIRTGPNGPRTTFRRCFRGGGGVLEY